MLIETIYYGHRGGEVKKCAARARQISIDPFGSGGHYKYN